MPAWPIHLALANKLKPNNQSFLLGNILPDILDGHLITPSHTIDKNQSHFRINKKITPSLFIQENKDKLNNPLILGYLTHLLTDEFYNKYISKNHLIKKDNQIYVILNNQELMPKTKETLNIKWQELQKYSEKLNINQTPLTFDENTLNLLKDLPFKYTKEDITKTIKTINKIIKNPTSTNISYRLFTEKELDKLYENCYIYLKDCLNNLLN